MTTKELPTLTEYVQALYEPALRGWRERQRANTVKRFYFMFRESKVGEAGAFGVFPCGEAHKQERKGWKIVDQRPMRPEWTLEEALAWAKERAWSLPVLPAIRAWRFEDDE